MGGRVDLIPHQLFIAREREAAARLTREITAEIEAQILGTQPAKA